VTGTDPIPLVDLGIQHEQIAAEVGAGWERVLASTAFVKGPDVDAFEQEFAAFSGVDHCVGLANGTDALELALRSVGVGQGDAVVLPANTFIATAEAVVRAGAYPVLVDCDPVHLLLEPDQARAAVTASSARALIAVDLYGQRAPLEAFTDLLGSSCAVVEDAAQSQGATRLGRGIAADADVAATSFYPGKNLGAYGDGGAVLTNRSDLATSVRLLGDHGSRTRYVHETLGFNSRLDTLQAVVLRAKLRRLTAWNHERQAAASRYDVLLGGNPAVCTPGIAPGNQHVWHLYVVRLPDRDRVLEQLHAAGIGAGIHYPTPIHLQPAFHELGLGRGAFPHTEAAAAEMVSLPLYPGISASQQERVAEVLLAALDG
jgi:dTDP-4-amino-4,6-dideoxygalactose transaminase